MSLPIGLSGTSLALGIFNATQIASIKSQMEKLSAPVSITSTEIETPPPVIEEPQAVVELEPLEETTFSDATSEETHELQGKITELERFSNRVSTRSIQNTNNITIKGDELNRLSTFVTDSLISIRERTASAENSIVLNQSNVGLNKSSISDLVNDVLETNGRIDLSALDISDLGSGLVTMQQRMDTSESNAVELSSQISDVVLAADAAGDNISLLDDLLVDTKESLESVIGSLATFNEVAFVADNKLKVSTLQGGNSNLTFLHNNAQASALHWVSDFSRSDWSSYLANTTGKTPSGKAITGFGAVSGWALRTIVGNKSNDGIIFGNEVKNFFSVSGGGILDLGANSRMGDIFSNAAFGHRSNFNATGFCVIQNGNGKTQINSASGQHLNLCNNGSPIVQVESTKAVTIINGPGVNNTHFNHENKGNNWIRSGSFTNFSFGTGSPSVVITNNEVTAGGVKLKATIQALEARIKALESKSYVLNNTKIRLRNGNNNKLARKANSNNSMIVDSTTKDSRSQWEVNII